MKQEFNLSERMKKHQREMQVDNYGYWTKTFGFKRDEIEKDIKEFIARLKEEIQRMRTIDMDSSHKAIMLNIINQLAGDNLI